MLEFYTAFVIHFSLGARSGTCSTHGKRRCSTLRGDAVSPNLGHVMCKTFSSLRTGKQSEGKQQQYLFYDYSTDIFVGY